MTNQISGDTHLGAVVQAGAVHGGVHVHTTAVPPPTPRQLPQLTRAWTDRKPDLDRLEAAVRTQPPHASTLCVLTGVGGVGKTALATHWLRQHAKDTPHGQLHVDLRGPHTVAMAPVSTAVVLRRWLRALGHRGLDGDTDELTGWWRSTTADRRLALLVDNPADADQVRALLPGGQGHLVAITARRPMPELAADGAYLHHLDPFTTDVALDLLAQLIGDARVAREMPAAEQLAARCGHLPLTLCLAAAHLASRPRTSVATAAVSLTHRTTTAEGTAPVLDTAYQDLLLPTARVYRLLGTLPLTLVDADAVAAACAMSPGDAEWHLQALTDARLIDAQGARDGRGACYLIHDEVRAHAAARARERESATARRETERRWGDWLLVTTTRAERLLTPAHRELDRDITFGPTFPAPFDTATGALEWLESHQNDLDAAVRAAEKHGWDALVWQLVHAMWPLFHLLRPLELWLDLHRRGLAAARRAGHRLAEREMLTTTVIGLRGLNQYGEAHTYAADALALAREDDDPRGEAQALHELGVCHHALGELELATAVLEQALEIREHVGYVRGVGLSRLTLGLVALDAGHTECALERLTRAHTELVQVNDRHDAARAQAWRGRVWAVRGDYAKAWALIDGALAEFREVGAVPWQARTLAMLGRLAEDQQQLDHARHLYTQGLEIATASSPEDVEPIRSDLRRVVGLLDPAAESGNAGD